MTTEVNLWLCDDSGERLAFLNPALVDLFYMKRVNHYGVLSITVFGDKVPDNYLAPDRQIQVWVKPPQGSFALDFLGFMRFWERTATGAAENILRIECVDQNEILYRRIIPYAAGHDMAYASATAADDVMKSIFSNNFLAAALDADREIQAVLDGVTVAGDLTAGPTISRDFHKENVLEVLQAISQQTKYEGAEVFFELRVKSMNVNTGSYALEFVTHTGQPGADKTWTTGNPVIFGIEYGNLSLATLSHDYREEVNSVYVNGLGNGEWVYQLEVEDVGQQQASLWNRREEFLFAGDVRTQTAAEAGMTVSEMMTDRGNQRLNETRPVTSLVAELQSTQHTLYGRDWTLGDKVTVSALGQQFDGIIRAVAVNITAAGVEAGTAVTPPGPGRVREMPPGGGQVGILHDPGTGYLPPSPSIGAFQLPGGPGTLGGKVRARVEFEETPT